MCHLSYDACGVEKYTKKNSRNSLISFYNNNYKNIYKYASIWNDDRKKEGKITWKRNIFESCGMCFSGVPAKKKKNTKLVQHAILKYPHRVNKEFQAYTCKKKEEIIN